MTEQEKFIERYKLWKSECHKIAESYGISDEMFYKFLNVAVYRTSKYFWKDALDWKEAFKFLDLAVKELNDAEKPNN